jgi:hypothetical protein
MEMRSKVLCGSESLRSDTSRSTVRSFHYNSGFLGTKLSLTVLIT